MNTILSLLLVLSFSLTISGAQPLFNPQIPSTTGNGGSVGIQVSDDGRFVLFQSNARDLVTNTFPGHGQHLYLADRESNSVQLITVSTNLAIAATGTAESPSMSDDGRFVVFSSLGTNFVTRDTHRFADIFLHDVANRTNRIVNLSSNRLQVLGAYNQPAISRDGSKVAFFSNANLLPQDRNVVRDLYVYNTADNKLTLATTPTNIFGDMGTLHSPQFSDDARLLVFQGGATNSIFVRELNVTNLHNISSTVVDAATRYGFLNVIHRGSAQPFITAGETNIYFRAEITTSTSSVNGAYIFRCNLVTGRSDLIARTESGANDSPFGPVATADGAAAFFVRTGTVQRATAPPLTIGAVSRPLPTPFQTGQIAESPHISSDGSVLIYVSAYTTEAPGQLRIVRQNLTTDELAVLPFLDPLLCDASADGRWILLSTSTPLDSSDRNSEYDVILYDALEQKSHLISKSIRQSTQVPGALVFLPNGISANEQLFAFSSASSLLVSDDTNGLPDVFTYNRETQQVTLESRTPTNLFNGASGNQILSPNGEWLAFVSFATNIVPNVSTQRDLFLKNLKTGYIYTVVPTNAATWALSNYTFNAQSTRLLFQLNRGTFLRDLQDHTVTQVPRLHAAPVASPTFSPDGSTLFFASNLPDLIDPPQTSGMALYSFDLTNSITFHGNINNATVANSVSEIAPSTNDITLVRNGVRILKVDRNAGTVTQICSDCLGNFAISSDGSWYAVRDLITLNTLPASDVIRLHLSGQDGLLRAFPVRLEEGPEMDISHISMSPDNGHIAFVGRRYPVFGYNAPFELFLYSRSLHAVTQILPTIGTNEPADYVASAQFSADGKRLYFQSSLPITGADDRDEFGSIFYIDILAETGDTDADGLADKWEVTYFGDLTAIPSADSDSDGATNLEEYRAGTNPTTDASVLRIFGVNLAQSPGIPLVVFSSVPGKRYQVQYKERFDQSWIELANPTATQSTTTVIDNLPKPFGEHQRYYRVMLRE